MTARLAPSNSTDQRPNSVQRALRCLLRIEEVWLLRQIGSERPVVWLRQQPLGRAARHGILSLRAGPDAFVRGALKAHADAWPFADGTLNAIVLQHVVEGTSWGDWMLAEASRVLAPEGRLYLLRFDRLSPWYWRYGRTLLRHHGAPAIGRPLNLQIARSYGLTLEYRHALGSRGLRADPPVLASRQRTGERLSFVSAMRATRIWVLRKRKPNWLKGSVLEGGRRERADFGLAMVRRESRRTHL